MVPLVMLLHSDINPRDMFAYPRGFRITKWVMLSYQYDIQGSSEDFAPSLGPSLYLHQLIWSSPDPMPLNMPFFSSCRVPWIPLFVNVDISIHSLHRRVGIIHSLRPSLKHFFLLPFLYSM